MNWTLGGSKIGDYRQKLLSKVYGNVLEIGFGTGLNLPYYPPSLGALTALDPNPGMLKKAGKRLAKSPLQVGLHRLHGEKLPFENQTFDCVVQTWTLCSIKDPELALWEIHRVLKNDGKLFFIEHGLSPDPKVRLWQRRLTPWQRRWADGCHLDRDMAALIESAGFRFMELKKFYHEDFPKVAGFFYQGIAEKVSR